MNLEQTGRLIAFLRHEKNLTQRALADKLNISDKTVSKWERGLGLPDMSILSDLSRVLEVDIEKILSGATLPGKTTGSNMKKLTFFICPVCGNVLTSTGCADIVCCGRRLSPLSPQQTNDTHFLNIESIENDCYITFSHPMSKEHHISFVAYVSFDRILLVRLYPEQGAEVRIPHLHGGKFYFYCNNHGLFTE